MKLVVCEKWAQSKSILSALKAIYPDDVFAVICTRSLGWFLPKLPSISFDDIPWAGEPTQWVYRPAVEQHPVTSIQPWRQEVLTKCSVDETFHDFYGRDFEQILMFVDPDSVGVFAGTELLRALSLSCKDVTWYMVMALSEDRIRKAILTPELLPLEMRTSWVAQRENKRLFDHWWAANSMLVFGELKKTVGLLSPSVLTKYELQALCKLSDSPNGMSTSDMVDWMYSPDGTGRYQSSTARVGSSISHTEILKSLVENHELVTARQDGRKSILQLSEAGRSFVAMLHPKTSDPDLPFRIDAWLKSENPANDRVVMERYIRQLFGRQLRFQRKCRRLDPLDA